jgi:hypothetical protein
LKGAEIGEVRRMKGFLEVDEAFFVFSFFPSSHIMIDPLVGGKKDGRKERQITVEAK